MPGTCGRRWTPSWRLPTASSRSRRRATTPTSTTSLLPQLLAEVAAALNAHHSCQHSMGIGTSLIGPWLQNYVQTLFNRYFTLEQALQRARSVRHDRAARRRTTVWGHSTHAPLCGPPMTTSGITFCIRGLSVNVGTSRSMSIRPRLTACSVSPNEAAERGFRLRYQRHHSRGQRDPPGRGEEARRPDHPQLLAETHRNGFAAGARAVSAAVGQSRPRRGMARPGVRKTLVS